MSGTSSSGRRADTPEQRALRGTYRKDRHGSGVDPAGGIPIKPPGLDEHASKMWDAIADSPLGIAKEIDSASLRACCEMWGLYRKSFELALIDPTDKDTRIATTSYLAAFDKLAARFGLTPSDRARLKLPAPAKEDDNPLTILKHSRFKT